MDYGQKTVVLYEQQMIKKMLGTLKFNRSTEFEVTVVYGLLNHDMKKRSHDSSSTDV